MNRTGLIRLGGLAAVVGGVPYAAHGLVIVICTPNCPASLSSKTSVLFVLLLLGAMAAITALHALQWRLYGWAGAVASLTTFIGLTLTLVGGLGEVLATSPSARMADWYHLTGYFLFGGMLVAPIGSILLGVMTMGAGVLPWWGGAHSRKSSLGICYSSAGRSSLGTHRLRHLPNGSAKHCTSFASTVRSRGREAMRAMSVIRYVIFGAVGFSIGWAVAGLLNTIFTALLAPCLHFIHRCRLWLTCCRISRGSLPGHVWVRPWGWDWPSSTYVQAGSWYRSASSSSCWGFRTSCTPVVPTRGRCCGSFPNTGAGKLRANTCVAAGQTLRR